MTPNRLNEILRYLMDNKNEYLSSNDIASVIGVSDRTIRSDISMINTTLMEEGISSSIESFRGLGYKLVYKDKEELNFESIYNNLLDKKINEESNQMYQGILLALLLSKKSLSLKELAEENYIDPKLVRKILDESTSFLDKWDLKLVVKPKFGCTIDGNENHKRMAISELLNIMANQNQTFSTINEYLGEDNVQYFQSLIKNVERRFNITFLDESFFSIIIHGSLMLKRFQNKTVILLTEENPEINKGNGRVDIVNYMIEKVEKDFRCVLPKEEVKVFTVCILSQRIKGDLFNDEYNNDPRSVKLTNQLINSIQPLVEAKILEDTMLRKGLILHLNAVFYRLDHNKRISNPLTAEIKSRYPFLFYSIYTELEDYYRYDKYYFSEGDVAYIVLHIAASISREGSKKQQTAVIVCHLGYGVSTFLQSKLESIFQNLTIVKTVGMSDLDLFLSFNEVDWILTTIKMEKDYCNAILIDPIVSRNDIEVIKEKMISLETNNISGKNKVFQESKLFNPFMIFTQRDPMNIDEILTKMCKTLYENGYVKEKFKESVIKREKLSTTTIGNGISIPHGDTKLVNTDVIMVYTFRKPVQWKGEKVSVVFLIAVKHDMKSQLKLKSFFNNLSIICDSKDRLKNLVEAISPMEAIEILEGKSIGGNL